MDYGSRRVFVLVEGLDGDADNLSLDILRQKRHPRPERVAVVFQVCLELVQRQKGRGVLLKLLVKQSKKVGRRPVDEESLLIAGLDTERVWSTPVHHPKKLRLRLVSAEARRFTRVLAFYHPIFWRVVKQGRDGVVDDSHDTLEMFLAARDVFVEVRTLEAVSLEELREDARVRVDHVDVGVAVVRESFSDVTL